MKRIIRLILFAICMLPIMCCAQLQVSESEAIAAALKESNDNNRSIIVDTVCILVNNRGDTLMYEIMLADGSAVLVSGHKACTPIIGLYKNRRQPICGNQDNIPCGLRFGVKNCISHIDSLFHDDSRFLIADSEWTMLLSDDTLLRSNQRTSVGPLIQTKWGQWVSNDGEDLIAYNEFAPGEDSCTNGLHCPAGCVAVAMGQVMKYWNYPFFLANSSVVFDWCNMPNQLITTNPCYEINKAAINNLLNDCGISVEMEYTCSGSGAYLEDAVDALVSRYLYSNATAFFQVGYNIQYTQIELLSKVQDNLDAGRPVIINAFDNVTQKGHAFICDGYKEKKYYINWGWNGDYDGLFNFWQLSPYVYSFEPISYKLVYNIIPAVSYSGTSQQMDLSNYYTLFSTFAPDLLSQPYKIVPTESHSLLSASDSCPTGWRTIPANSFSVYQAQEEIILRNGFSVELGADFTAQIVPCANCEMRGEDMVEEEPGGFNANSEESDTEGYLYAGPSFTEPLADLYPNPTSWEVTVSVDGDVQAIVIYNAMGQPVGGWKLQAVEGGVAILDVSSLPTGNYLLTVRTTDNIVTKKLVVQRR